MHSYRENRAQEPAFRVRYRFLTHGEGGRQNPPRQHIRFDFLYEGDDPLKDGISMIWPEFLSPEGEVLPEGEVPMAGVADMFILIADRLPYHRDRIRVGTRGYMVEGPKRVAECEVIALGAVANAI